MQKSLIYFSVLMSVIYVGAGAYLLFGSVLGLIAVPFKFQNILGGVIMGYGIFRLIRGMNQFKTLRDSE